MIELFEQDVRTNARQSSKGNQLKWENQNFWYKADYTGYEGLAEYVISHLLQLSDLQPEEYVLYEPVQIRYHDRLFTGARSRDFLEQGWQIFTLERLFQQYFGESLNKAVWSITAPAERLSFLVNQVERITGLPGFGKHMNKVLTIDAVFLNEDRHTHNLAVLMNEKGEFRYCPIFDNGAGLLADTTIDYPLGADEYTLISRVKGKTFSTSLEEQMNVSEELYGMNLHFRFTGEDIDMLLASNEESSDACYYPAEIRSRVKKILHEQMRKYLYLFK